ncbi:MAG TPA: glycosyl hydrolase-related protein, partial [Gemmatimonadales bacterium]|nr:glycosyl hydrolase-related protein [Gemmatimonadales bacterium]
MQYGALWRGVTDLGSDLFRWVGPDGRALLVYHLPPSGYEIGAALSADPETLAQQWPAVRSAVTRNAATSHIAIFVGADHHAAHPALPALAQAIAALEPAAEVRISRLDEFLAAAGEELQADRIAIPEIAGEQRWSGSYTWSLQGVHGTRAHQKRRNALIELLLERSAEPLAALAQWTCGTDRRPLLAAAWRMLVRAHFHDTLGGCCADPVARAADHRWDEAEAIGREAARAAAEELIGHDPDAVREGRTAGPALILWNPAARRRSGVVVAQLSGFKRDVLIGPPGGRTPQTGAGLGEPGLTFGGESVPIQVLGRGTGLERRDAPHHYPDLDEVELVQIAFQSPAVSGLGFARLDPGDFVAAQGDVVVAGASTRNSLVSIAVAEDGTITLSDFARHQQWKGLLVLESEGDRGDTYTPATDGRIATVARPVAVSVGAAGPLVGSLELRGGLELPTGSVDFTLGLELRSGSPVVRCTLSLDNRATDHRLRLRLPLGIRGEPAIAGTQMGGVNRPAADSRHSVPTEAMLPTAPAHRYAGAANQQAGAALLAPGFFEYEWAARGDLLMTVLRSVGQLSRGDLPTRPGHAGWYTPTPDAQVQGPDRLQFALLPADRALLENHAAMIREWEDVFLPIRAVWYRETTSAELPRSGFELQGEGLVMSAVKPAEDGQGVILRCYNPTSVPIEGRWLLPDSAHSAELTRADESPGA